MAFSRKFGVGPRCAAWLKEIYPHNRGKLIARDFKVSESTVWRWLAGEAPTVRSLEEMASRWGRPFIEYIFADTSGPSAADLRHLLAVREELDRRDTAGAEPPKPVPAPPEPTAPAAAPAIVAGPDVQYSRNTPPIDLLFWGVRDPGALRSLDSQALRTLSTHLIEKNLAADPSRSRVQKALVTLRSMLRIS